ncbi:unnamed protein product [Urochloa decumbens]|uniref:F-box domain-containing protein n=1 Tax=Urochloa decumbens TaxID=240449 RepID=A0ABC9GLY8_9POAL
MRSRKHLGCAISMEDLPEALLEEIIKRLPTTSDLNSISLVCKRLHTVEAELRDTIYVGCGVSPVTPALASLCSRFRNLCKMEFNYSGWTPNHGMQLDNQDLHVFSSCCLSLMDLTLSFCSYIDDFGLGFLACFKKLISLRLKALPEITSAGLLSVAVGCKSLSALCLMSCKNVGSVEWLEYLGKNGSLEELVVENWDEGPLTCTVLESLKLVRCIAITNAGMRHLARSPSLINLTLELCDGLTDRGVAEVVRARKLESLTIEKCSRISLEAVQGAAKTVHYTDDCPGYKEWANCCVYGPDYPAL